MVESINLFTDENIRKQIQGALDVLRKYQPKNLKYVSRIENTIRILKNMFENPKAYDFLCDYNKKHISSAFVTSIKNIQVIDTPDDLVDNLYAQSYRFFQELQFFF